MPSFGMFTGDSTWSSSDDDTEHGFSTLFSPVYPYNRWPVLVPFVAVAGAAAVVLLTGVAAASLVVMSFALVVVVFLLSEVFGYEIAMPAMPAGFPR
jgi:hypothetical protein